MANPVNRYGQSTPQEREPVGHGRQANPQDAVVDSVAHHIIVEPRQEDSPNQQTRGLRQRSDSSDGHIHTRLVFNPNGNPFNFAKWPAANAQGRDLPRGLPLAGEQKQVEEKMQNLASTRGLPPVHPKYSQLCQAGKLPTVNQKPHETVGLPKRGNGGNS